MNVSQEDARASLTTIRDVRIQTQRAVTSAYANPIMILWGILWIIAFTATHFYIDYAYHIFITMGVIGSVGTAIIFRLFHSKAPFRDDPSERIGWRVAALWILLFVYIMIWLFLFAPFSGMQCNAFISTAAMFAYVVMGLWFGSTFMIVLGLAMTGVTLVGFYLLTSYYCLWMAMMGGGTLLGTGLYIRVRWR
ncbi:hypothetical protein ACFL5Z_11760 [Planctomycetota bacterium]